MNTHHILVVDDDASVSALLSDLLSAEGYRVTVAANGRAALSVVAADRPDLILTDLNMPHMDGNELCARIKSNPATQLLPVVMLTGQNEQAAKLTAWELGVDDFLAKPFDFIEIRVRCRSLLRMKGLVDQLDSAESVVFAFARAVDAKSPYTSGHSERVTAYVQVLAQRAGLSAQEQALLRKGGMLHDIGKINVPDAILNKPESLTAEEYGLIKLHPLQGVHIVEPLQSVREAIPLIRWHHERLDGKGYPDGLSGSAIPQMARVLAVADVFDALSSQRPYRPALAVTECLSIMRLNAAGGGLDPDLVNVFCEAQADLASAVRIAVR
jgi:putative two-component system response regulator